MLEKKSVLYCLTVSVLLLTLTVSRVFMLVSPGFWASPGIGHFKAIAVTYDHRLRRIGHPVRSAIHKPQIGRLVVEWVTISEFLLLYVFWSFFC